MQYFWATHDERSVGTGSVNVNRLTAAAMTIAIFGMVPWSRFRVGRELLTVLYCGFDALKLRRCVYIVKFYAPFFMCFFFVSLIIIFVMVGSKRGPIWRNCLWIRLTSSFLLNVLCELIVDDFEMKNVFFLTRWLLMGLYDRIKKYPSINSYRNQWSAIIQVFKVI